MISLLIIFVTSVFVGFFSAVVRANLLQRQGANHIRMTPLFVESFLASLTVPLFLNVTGSQILEQEGVYNSDGIVLSNYSILLGLSIIAGLYSDTFMRKVSERVIEGLEHANKRIDETESKISSQQKIIDDTNKALLKSEIESPDANYVAEKLTDLTDSQKSILKCFAATHQKFLTHDQLVKRCNELDLNAELDRLHGENLMDKLEEYGAWYLTAAGKRISQELL